MTTIEQIIIQTFIVLFSASAVWFVSRKEKWRRWGYILGLCGEPFWFYSLYHTKQWGIMVLCVWYAYSWGQGVYNFWIKK